MADTPQTNSIGRPSIFTQELADRLCEQLASGKSMRTVCAAEEMPSMTTVFSWLRTNAEFLKQYERAKAEAADSLVDEMIDIADDGSNDWMEVTNKDGSEGWKLNGEHVQRSRLRVDTRKWIASKLKPKKYGDKLDVTSGGEALKPLVLDSTVAARFGDAPSEPTTDSQE
ncbi:hypothetical protein [Arthrobacter sp. OY3WO11]|uniref:terminase small subunit-like protein n=1 Tax=Arthrobacter sp. OY3WO11 TaxID=1835723 RepID=UPI001C12B978|nr:hypothetical protein [Arthrobacter sp. OY3WO11]